MDGIDEKKEYMEIIAGLYGGGMIKKGGRTKEGTREDLVRGHRVVESGSAWSSATALPTDPSDPVAESMYKRLEGLNFEDIPEKKEEEKK